MEQRQRRARLPGPNPFSFFQDGFVVEFGFSASTHSPLERLSPLKSHKDFHHSLHLAQPSYVRVQVPAGFSHHNTKPTELERTRRRFLNPLLHVNNLRASFTTFVKRKTPRNRRKPHHPVGGTLRRPVRTLRT